MFSFISNIYSEYYSYLPKIFISIVNSVKIYMDDNENNEESEENIDVQNSCILNYKKRPYLTIDTNIDDNIVSYNYKKAVAKASDGLNNVQYFRSYLKYFYSCEKSEEEIERILETIKEIRISVKKDFNTLSSLHKNRITDIITYETCFYKKSTPDFIVKLYRTLHYGREAVVKIYIFYPKYLCTKYILQDRFENEIIFSIYAKTINYKCDFVSPEIYAYGSFSLHNTENLEVKYLFIIMEFFQGISLKYANFTPEVCTKVYEIKRKLSCELLSHNDLQPRNIMIDSSNNMIVLDYGESSYCI